MHDTDFEDRLRRTLRGEAESLPFTLTADVVEQRLAQRRRARRSRYGMLAAAASIVVLVGGAVALGRPASQPIGGSPAPSADGSNPSSFPSPTASARADLRYTCGSANFSADMLVEPGNAHLDDDPAAEALRAFLATGGEAAILPDTGWYVVARSLGTVEWVAFVPGADPQFATASAHLEVGAWRIDGWGGCTPEVAIDGLNVATWTLDPAAAPLGPDSTSFVALVTERACASGRPPGDRLQSPLVTYESDRVVVVFTVRPQTGGQDCQGNPSTPVTVTLSEPLGDRQLLDGALLPPVDPRPSPEPSLAPQPSPPALPAPLAGVSNLFDFTGAPGEPSGSWSAQLPAGTDDVVFELACTGSGIEIELDGRRLAYECGAEPVTFVDLFPARSDLTVELRVEAFGPYAARLGARDVDAVPGLAFRAPPAELSAPGPVFEAGARGGCLSFELADGTSGADQCGPDWDSLPDDRILDVPAGATLTFILKGWNVERLAVDHAFQGEIDASHGDPAATRLFESSAPREPMTFPAPPPGDWGLRVQVTATESEGGESFSGAYYFRVRVGT